MSPNLLLWDFRDCAADAISSWRVEGAQRSCRSGPDGGLTLQNGAGDTQLLSPSIDLQPLANNARFLRLRISMSSTHNDGGEPLHSQWFWRDEKSSWTEEQSRSMVLRKSAMPSVYWTFIPVDEAQDPIRALRLDPTDGSGGATIQWIAADLVR